jgi:hypothetical protein
MQKNLAENNQNHKTVEVTIIETSEVYSYTGNVHAYNFLQELIKEKCQ